MDAFDLHVKQAVRIEENTGLAGDVVGQSQLVRSLGGGKGATETVVIGKWSQFLELIQIEAPSVTNPLIEQC